MSDCFLYNQEEFMSLMKYFDDMSIPEVEQLLEVLKRIHAYKTNKNQLKMNQSSSKAAHELDTIEYITLWECQYCLGSVRCRKIIAGECLMCNYCYEEKERPNKDSCIGVKTIRFDRDGCQYKKIVNYLNANILLIRRNEPVFTSRQL